MAEETLGQQLLKNPKETADALKMSGDELVKFAANLDKATESVKDYSDEWAKLHPVMSNMLKDMKAGKRETKSTSDALTELAENLDEIAVRDDVLSSVFNKKSSKDATDNIASIEEELENLSKKIESGAQLTADDIIRIGELNKTKKRIQSITKEIMSSRDAMKDAFGKGGFIKGFGNIKKQFMEAQGDSDKMTGMLKGLEKSGMLGKGGSKLAGSLSKLAGPLSKVGGVASVLSTAHDAVVSSDDRRKKANQEYTSLSGPQMDGSGFRGRTRKYNKGIRDIDFNMEMGMGADDWNAMFQSMKGAGVGVDQLSKSLGSQKDVMRSVRETGVALGMSTDVMGEAYTTMSLETKSGLQTIQDGFEDVARGAQRAGISTDKFYSTIQASVLAMGSYGNFISIAASSLDKLSASAGMSLQDASSMANATTTGFKDMGAQERLSYAGLLTSSKGGKADMMGEMDKVLAGIDEKLKGPGLTEKERSDLGARKYRITEAKKSNDLLAFANILPDLAGATSKMDMDVLTMAMGGSSKNMVEKMRQGQYSQYADKLVGKEKADRYMGVVQGNMSQLGGVSSINSAIQKDPSLAGKLGSVLDVLGKGELMTPEDNAFAEAQLEEIAKASGMTSSQTKDLIAMSKKTPKAFAKSMKPGLEKGQISAEEIAVGSAGALQDATDRWNKDQVKGQNEIIKELTPMQKMFDITKESIFYDMDASDAAIAASKTLVDIKKAIYSLAEIEEPSSEDATAAVEAAYTSASAITSSGAGSGAVSAVSKMSNKELLEDYAKGGESTKIAKSMGITNAEDFSRAAEGKSGKDLTDSYINDRQSKLNSAIGADKMINLQEETIDAIMEEAGQAYVNGDQKTFEEKVKLLRGYGMDNSAINSGLNAAVAQRKANQAGGVGAFGAIVGGALGFVVGGFGAIPGAALGGTIAGGVAGALYSDDSDKINLQAAGFANGGDVYPALLSNGESVVTPEHKSNFMKFMDGLSTNGSSGMGSSNRTLSVGTMNITQPTDTNGIMNMFKRQEFNAMAS